MKKRKSLLVVCLFALVLVLGVGYAAVTAVDLKINGSASVKDETLEVYFSGLDMSASVGATINAEVNEADKDTEVSFTVTEMVLNETVTLAYEIKNAETDLDANLAAELSASNKYFEVSGKFTEGKALAGQTDTYTITVKMIKTPVDEANNTINVIAKLTASPEEAEAKQS